MTAVSIADGQGIGLRIAGPPPSVWCVQMLGGHQTTALGVGPVIPWAPDKVLQEHHYSAETRKDGLTECQKGSPPFGGKKKRRRRTPSLWGLGGWEAPILLEDDSDALEPRGRSTR